MTSTDYAAMTTAPSSRNAHGLFGTRRWLDAMASRIEGRHEPVAVGSGDDRVEFFTSVIDETAPASKNPYQLAFARCAAMRTLTDDGARELATISPRSTWFPARVVVLPGLETYATGPGARSVLHVDAAVDHLERISLGSGAQRCLAFLYTQPEDVVLRDVLRRRGYVEVPSATRCNVSLPGTTYDDFLTSLPRGRRRQFTDVDRRMARSGNSLERLDVVAAVDRLVDLRLAHRARHGRRRDEDGERALLLTLATQFPEETRAIGVVGPRGDLVGFALTVRSGDVLHVWTTGWDESAVDRATAYYATCFNGAIRQAYEDGCAEVSFGYGSEEQKLHRGARVAYTLMHVRGDAALMAEAPAAGHVIRRAMRYAEDPVSA